MYRIVIDYETGDSFSNERCIKYLDGTWRDIIIVEENLKRIKEHYEWYEEQHNYYSLSPKKNIKKPDYVSGEYDFSFKLLLDDRTEYQISAFWCGYFETLYSASVELDMKVSFR